MRPGWWIYRQLQRNDCSDRGLLAASKWATDLLLSFSPKKKLALQLAVEAQERERNQSSQSLFATSTPSKVLSPAGTSFTADMSTSFAEAHPTTSTPQTQSQSQSQFSTQPPPPAQAPGQPVQPLAFNQLFDVSSLALTTEERRFERERIRAEQDLLTGAKAYFDAREFHRVMYMLQGCQSSKALFLTSYSYFLDKSTEKKAWSDWHKLDGSRTQPPTPINTALASLLDRVQNAKDPWLLFLKALFLSRLSRREEAIEACLQSIAGYRFNWSTWILLGSCINDAEELSSILTLIPLPPTNFLVQLFLVRTLNELQSAAENELTICDRLLSEEFFPHSMGIMSLRASVLYHLHEYENAELQFDAILRIDPYRVDDIDIFSNILYVQDNKLKLSRLAHDFLNITRDRPEVCCLVGNHYSLRQEHEKAIKYFRRATELDRTYLTAWTLMGHEYVEMKNSHAAIEAYRRAVDINRKDYRAWYGLGQAYELLSMHNYALYYYQHATALRSYDVRLWQAQGSCYEELGRPREAIECYKRALISSELHETLLCLKLARLHTILDERPEAVAYHKRVIEFCLEKDRPIHEYAKSSIEVALWHISGPPGGDLNVAKELLEKVAASNVEEVTRAAELLKNVKARIREREAQANASMRSDI
ncbi:hypothetical protein NMY22_g1718 [Coprinellus aureogranulatus]|nr:hypothetical protein NMY22_g1718 [Coprinellus aureogranulatus]